MEEKEKDKRKEEEQREAKGNQIEKKQRTEETKEVQNLKGFEDKGRHTYSLR